MKYIKLYESYSNGEESNHDDAVLTAFRRSVSGYGSLEDLKSEYSYSNEKDVDEIFDIIESYIFNALVVQKMNSYDATEDAELNTKIDSHIDFIRSIDGLSFENGELALNNINKEEVISKYLATFV
jgi:hypothetical protein